MLLGFHQRVVLIQKEIDQDGNIQIREELNDLKQNLLSASESPTSSKISRLHSFITVKFSIELV